MFGLLYMSEETRKKIKEAESWQDRFLERCRRIDKEIEESKKQKY